MTPRALPKGAGLRGPGQEIFPEDAKELARRIGLEEEAAQVYRRTLTDDEGGDTTSKWAPVGPKLDGRIDAVGRATGVRFVADQIDEATTHIVTLEPGADIDSNDRILIEGIMWTVTSEEFFTNEATVRIQVREVSTS